MPLIQLDFFEKDESKLVKLKLHRKPRKKKVNEINELRKSVLDLTQRLEALEKFNHK